MPDIQPVTRADLLKSVSASLTAQQRLRDEMAKVAAETAAARQQAAPGGTPAGTGTA
jgi:hypothetical protein